MLDESSDPIFSFTPDCHYSYANAAFATPFGKTPRQVMGATPHDIMPVEEANMRVAAVRSMLETRQELVIETRVPSASGDRFFLTTAKPVINAQQQLVMAQYLV